MGRLCNLSSLGCGGCVGVLFLDSYVVLLSMFNGIIVELNMIRWFFLVSLASTYRHTPTLRSYLLSDSSRCLRIISSNSLLCLVISASVFSALVSRS